MNFGYILLDMSLDLYVPLFEANTGRGVHGYQRLIFNSNFFQRFTHFLAQTIRLFTVQFQSVIIVSHYVLRRYFIFNFWNIWLTYSHDRLLLCIYKGKSL